MKLSIKDITQTFIALHLKYKVSSTAARINNLVFLSFWKLSINNGKTRKIFKDDVFAVESGFYYPTIIEYLTIEPKYSYCISKQDFKILVKIFFDFKDSNDNYLKQYCKSFEFWKEYLNSENPIPQELIVNHRLKYIEVIKQTKTDIKKTFKIFGV